MPDQRLPVQIAPFKLARQGQVLQGSIELNRMDRLAQMLAETNGSVSVTLQFGVDEQGIHFASGSLEVEVQMTCQRCMKPMSVSVVAEVALGFVSNDEQARNLAQGYEPYIVEQEPINLAEIVEDELILALPLVAVHEDQGCEPVIEELQKSAAEIDQADAKPNPFAVLSELKRQK